MNFLYNLFFKYFYKIDYINYKSLINETTFKDIDQKQQFKNIIKVFLKASQFRQEKSNYIEINIDNKKINKLEWNVYELSQLLKYINEQRLKNNLERISLNTLYSIDNHFAGYSDYFRKVSFYSTKLIFENEKSVLSYMRG